MATNDKVIVTKSKINSIVDAIHYKNNESNGYTLDQIPAKIKAIPSESGGGGALVLTAILEPNIVIGSYSFNE